MMDLRSEVADEARLALAYARSLHRAITNGRVAFEDQERFSLDLDADWLELLDSMALEVYGNAVVRCASGPDVHSIVIVTGTGGPHTEIEAFASGRVVGRAIWGSEQVERSAELDLFDYLQDLIM